MVKFWSGQGGFLMARKERNIYKRKDGRFEARFIKGRDENGKAKYGAVYAKSYAEVREKLEQAKMPEKESSVPKASRTVTAELENYLDAMKCQIKSSTHGIYQRYLENYIAPHFGEMRCDQLTLDISQGFVNKQLENGLSAVTVQSVFCFLKNGLHGVHPYDVFSVKIPKRVSNEVEVLSVDEQKRLEEAAKASDDINRIGVILCLYTGLRVGELCGLMWSDIDFERRLLHVRRTSQRVKNTEGTAKTKVTFLKPKSGTSQRSIPLPGFLIALLDEHLKDSSGEYVISRDGASIEPRNIQYRFKKLLASAKVKDVNFHTTRHTFATRALESGFDVKTLSEILGHASAAVTLKKYAHTMDEHKRRSMESLAALYR
jgi:integrase